jgi:hypothetical protein
MKPKKFETKLVLKKKTIANLGNGQLGIVKGGCVDTYPSCQTKLTKICVSFLLTDCVCPTDTCTCSACGTVCGGPYC